MTAGILNPADDPRAAAFRPSETDSGANARKWFDDNQSTRPRAQDFNRVLAQIRTAGDAAGVPDVEGDDAYLLKTIKGITRPKLTADTQFWVRADGSDAHDGTANSAGSAWATLQHAYDWIAAHIDPAGFKPIINIGTGGTYDGITVNNSLNAVMPIVGQVGDETAVVIRGALGDTGNPVSLYAMDGGLQLQLNWLTLQCPAGHATCRLANRNYLVLGSDDINGAGKIKVTGNPNVVLFASASSEIDILGTFTMALGGAGCVDLIAADFMSIVSFTADLAASSPVAFSYAAIWLAANSFCFFAPNSMTGTFTGPRRVLAQCSALISPNGLASDIPGSSNGTLYDNAVHSVYR